MDTMPPSSHDAAPLEPCPRVPPAGAGRKPINSTRGKGLRQPGIRPLHNLDKEAKQHFMVFFQKKNAAGDLINEYPSALEKAQLAQDTGYQVKQVTNWFVNARKRIAKPLANGDEISKVYTDFIKNAGTVWSGRTTEKAAKAQLARSPQPEHGPEHGTCAFCACCASPAWRLNHSRLNHSRESSAATVHAEESCRPRPPLPLQDTAERHALKPCHAVVKTEDDAAPCAPPGDAVHLDLPSAFAPRPSSPARYNHASSSSILDSSTHETLSMEDAPLVFLPPWLARERLGDAALSEQEEAMAGQRLEEEAFTVLQDLPWFDRCPSPLLDEGSFYL